MSNGGPSKYKSPCWVSFDWTWIFRKTKKKSRNEHNRLAKLLDRAFSRSQKVFSLFDYVVQANEFDWYSLMSLTFETMRYKLSQEQADMIHRFVLACKSPCQYYRWLSNLEELKFRELSYEKKREIDGEFYMNEDCQQLIDWKDYVRELMAEKCVDDDRTLMLIRESAVCVLESNSKNEWKKNEWKSFSYF